MALGNENEGLPGVEKFLAKCSICKKDAFVPFKPDPGRSVYCKECIAKLKSGELKPVKGSINQIKYDEAKFYKPLSDLGIEFVKKGKEAENRYPERLDKGHFSDNQTKTRPGIFSAIKKDGKRLYEHARAGEEVEIQARKTTIYEFQITRIQLPEVDFRITCSKGTYIRSIAYDFGLALESGGHLSVLRRTKIGNYSVINAIAPAAFEKSIQDEV
jgi:CxxC-x17-CxxC domain-containing protein